jgi:hypothetical protein
MKILFFLLISVACLGQGKSVNPYKYAVDSIHKVIAEKNVFIEFDALNGAKIIEADQAKQYFIKTDSIKRAIVIQMLQIKKIDFSRISEKGDSLIITSQGIKLKLKPKK